MFNMYLSGSSFGPIKNERNSPFYISIEIFLHFSPGVGVLPAMMLRFQARAFVQPFQSESPSALLSEIGNPFSWTRFLASSRDCKGDMLQALDCKWTRIQLEF